MPCPTPNQSLRMDKTYGKTKAVLAGFCLNVGEIGMTKEPEDEKVAGKAAPEDPRRAYSAEEMPAEHLAMLEQALEVAQKSKAKKSGLSR